MNVHGVTFWMDTRGFQRATPHTTKGPQPRPRPQRHTTTHKDTQQHQPSKQQHQPTKQPTHTQQKHSNTQQHHISFFFSFLPFRLFCLSFPFFVFVCVSLLVFVFYPVFLCVPIVSNDVSCFLLCLCLFSLCFHDFQMTNVTCVPFFPSLVSLLSFLLSPSTLSPTLQN